VTVFVNKKLFFVRKTFCLQQVALVPEMFYKLVGIDKLTAVIRNYVAAGGYIVANMNTRSNPNYGTDNYAHVHVNHCLQLNAN